MRAAVSQQHLAPHSRLGPQLRPPLPSPAQAAEAVRRVSVWVRQQDLATRSRRRPRHVTAWHGPPRAMPRARGFGAVLRSHNVAMIRQQALMRQPPAQALWLAIQASAAPASGHPACLAMSLRSAKAAEGYYASLLLHRTVRYRCCRRPPRAPAICAARTALAVRPASAPRRSKQRPALSVRLGRRTCAVVLGVRQCGPSPPPTSMHRGHNAYTGQK